MADYKDIVGTAVRNNAGNLSEGQKDQIFYDSTNVDFKYQFEAVSSAWRTGNDMVSSSVPGNFGGGSNGPQTSGIAVGSSNPSPTGRTELYDGTSWSTAPNTNTARRGMGVGATANTAAVAFGGEQSPTAWYALTESWNGSSWTEVNDLNAGRVSILAIGSSTAALGIGGVNPTVPQVLSETWDGTSWTEGADMNQGRSGNGATAGTTTSGLAWTGRPNYQVYCESWNGSTWTEVNDLNAAKGYMFNGGTSSAGWSAGGGSGSGITATTATEEWNANQPVGAFSTDASMNTGRANMGSVGTSTAALAIGGRSPTVGINEQYNGSSWTEVNDLNTARHSMSTSGTTTSALASGGENGGYRNIVEEWNGSAFTEITDINTTRGEAGGAGASAEAALMFGGASPGGRHAETESWNGTSWTEVNDLNTASFQVQTGVGRVYTAALCVGGRNPPTSYLNKTESWNGTSWTEVNNLNTARSSAAGQTGTNTSAIAAGGYKGPPASTGYSANNEEWNGVSWVEVADLNTVNSGAGGAGSDITAAIIFGGYNPPSYITASEKWSSSSVATKTIDTD